MNLIPVISLRILRRQNKEKKIFEMCERTTGRVL